MKFNHSSSTKRYCVLLGWKSNNTTQTSTAICADTGIRTQPDITLYNTQNTTVWVSLVLTLRSDACLPCRFVNQRKSIVREMASGGGWGWTGEREGGGGGWLIVLMLGTDLTQDWEQRIQAATVLPDKIVILEVLLHAHVRLLC